MPGASPRVYFCGGFHLPWHQEGSHKAPALHWHDKHPRGAELTSVTLSKISISQPELAENAVAGAVAPPTSVKLMQTHLVNKCSLAGSTVHGVEPGTPAGSLCVMKEFMHAGIIPIQSSLLMQRAVRNEPPSRGYNGTSVLSTSQKSALSTIRALTRDTGNVLSYICSGADSRPEYGS